MFSERAGKWTIASILSLTVVTVAFTAGYGTALWRNNSEQAAVNYTNPSESTLFQEVWDIVQADHINQPITDEALFYGAIKGLASATNDPYTQFFDPTETKAFNEVIDGSFEGIGAEIGEQDGQLVVIAPLPNTPAETAGLLTNDAIIKIDETDTADLSVDEAVQQIRGEAGTTVTLTIYRTGDKDVRIIPIVRDTINVVSTTYEVVEYAGKQYGHLSINNVDENAAAKTHELLNQVLLDQPAGLILDLRGNPGGLLVGAIDIASLFIEEGVIVSEEYSDGSVRSYHTSQTAVVGQQPKLVVLVNGGSASAAEIIAGALQDSQRAYVIGTQSFGKGSVQDYRQLSGGSSLKVTVAHWLTPSGHTIQDIGITPDLVVEGADAQLQAALEYLAN